MIRKILVVLVGGILCSSICLADDWPGYRGPNRDGKSPETGLLQEWPPGGPKLLWTIEGIGDGFSSPAISGGMIYLTGMIRRQGVLFAYDMEQNLKWKKTYGPEWFRTVPGVRSTPTVNDGRVYVISGAGTVYCFDAKTGQQVWSVDMEKEFGGQVSMWGFAESPLIVGDNVICTPGGKEAAVAALNKVTGATAWKCKVYEQKSSPCSPIVVQRGSRNLIITMLDDYIVGIDGATGELLWEDGYGAYQGKPTAINAVSPIYHDGGIYATSGYDDGGVMLELSDDGGAITRKWSETTLDCHHGGVVLVDGHVYGSNFLSVATGTWACIEWATGKEKYVTVWNNKGSTIYADGMLYCYDEQKGHVALVKPDPAGFDIVSWFPITQGRGNHWAHPAISDRVLYIRHGKVLMAYDIGAEKVPENPGSE